MHTSVLSTSYARGSGEREREVYMYVCMYVCVCVCVCMCVCVWMLGGGGREKKSGERKEGIKSIFSCGIYLFEEDATLGKEGARRG